MNSTSANTDSDAADRLSDQEELRRLNAELERQAADLKAVNQTLVDSEQRLRLAIETGRIGLWVWNSTDVSNSGDWSPRLKEIFGLPLDAEVTHDMFLKSVHPEDRARVNDAVMQALGGAKGGEYRIEYRSVHPRDGAEGWVTARGQAFFDAQGQPVRFLGTVMDITERKRAEQAANQLNLELEQRIAARTAELRGSEILARGQLSALTRTLEALATESVPDRVIEHVLRTTTDQLGAHSSSVWLRDGATSLMVFEFALENGEFMTKANAPRYTVIPSLKIETVWPWSEVFRTRRPHLLEDIREGSSFPWHEQLISEGVVSVLVVPMLIAGQVEGVIGLRFTAKRVLRAEELELAQALVNQAMLAVQLNRLSAQSRAAAVTVERNRMARDIHDTLAQGFTGVIVQLEAAEEAMSQCLAEQALGYVERAGELARESLHEARRSVQALRPHALEEKNLCEAWPCLMQKMTAGTALRTAFDVRGERREMPPEWEENLLRIGQEALTNAIRHARASQFRVQLEIEPHEIRAWLADDGRGFDPTDGHAGFGLQGMRERVESMGGRFSIETATDRGTTLYLALPVPGAAEARDL